VKAWAMVPKEERERVIDRLDLWGAMCHEDNAYRAAVAVLREAAPYDDDELVIRVSRYDEVGHVCGWVDEGDGAVMVEYITTGEHIEGAHLILCEPLTPATESLLAALSPASRAEGK
jgi:hypothetical protein